MEILRHRRDVVPTTASARWRNSRVDFHTGGKTDEAPLELLKRALVGIGCSADDFDAAKAKLSEKFKDDEKEITAEFCAEFGFGLHNLIGTTAPQSSGPPAFTPPPNFAP